MEAQEKPVMYGFMAGRTGVQLSLWYNCNTSKCVASALFRGHKSSMVQNGFQCCSTLQSARLGSPKKQRRHSPWATVAAHWCWVRLGTAPGSAPEQPRLWRIFAIIMKNFFSVSLNYFMVYSTYCRLPALSALIDRFGPRGLYRRFFQ
jgi:hypothetical protein